VEPLGVAGVFPRLILETAFRSALVFDKTVAVAVPVPVDPLESGERRSSQVPDE
jgi:hypothetical protein